MKTVPEVGDGILLLGVFNSVHGVFTKPPTDGHESNCRQNRRAELAASGTTLVLGYVLARLRGSTYPMLFAVIVIVSLVALYESAARWPEKWA